MKEEYWFTKTGEKVAVSNMTETHVKNVLRMLIRKGVIDILREQSEDHEPISGEHEWWKGEYDHNHNQPSYDFYRR